MKSGRQIDGEDGIPLFGWESLQGRHVLDTGIVNQNIQAAGRIQVCSIISRIDSGLDMSAPEYDTSTLNSAAISACARVISSALPKPLSTIRDPAPASARAMPRPMPLVEPVTSETFPISACPLEGVGCLMAMFMAADSLYAVAFVG